MRHLSRRVCVDEAKINKKDTHTDAQLPSKMGYGTSRGNSALCIPLLFHILMFTRAATSYCFVPHSTARRRQNSSAIRKISSSIRRTPLSMQQKKVFCYGDSLTAGTSPPLAELHPYGPHLESELKRLVPDLSPVVRWSGYPGWTATAMAEGSTLDGPSGLRTFLRNIDAKTGSPASLCVILAGTNDLTYEVEAQPILDAIVSLHRACHGEGVRTAAVGIPPSAWQRQSSDAANMAATINDQLEEWCESSSEARGMATYIACPISASSVGNELWCSDGLHFSPAGFKALGEGLAPSIAKILE